MSEEEKSVIDFFIHECEKYDGTVEIKGISVGEETRILDTIIKFLKELNSLKKIEQQYKEEKEKNKKLEIENFNIKQQKIIDKKSLPHQENFYDYYNYIHKDKIKEVFDRIIKIIGCEKAEVEYNSNDTHYQYWDCFESVILNMQKELLKKEKQMLKHNEMIIKIIEKCDYMIKNRFYMNDIAIRKNAEEIKDIAKFYIEEPRYYNRDEEESIDSKMDK